MKIIFTTYDVARHCTFIDIFVKFQYFASYVMSPDRESAGVQLSLSLSKWKFLARSYLTISSDRERVDQEQILESTFDVSCSRRIPNQEPS
jgi:hypothetical protein